MRIAVIVAAIAALAITAPPGFSQGFEDTIPPPKSGVTKRYGKDPAHVVSLYRAAKVAPLIVFLGDYDWPSASPSYSLGFLSDTLVQDGFTVAWVGYRKPMKVGIVESAADVAQAIAMLRTAERTRVAADGFVVIGKGTGAGLAALIGCDPAILTGAGIRFADLKAVALLDGDGFDAPAEVVGASKYRRAGLFKAFGQSEESQRMSSAIGHVASPNAPAFHFAISKRPEGRISMSRNFAKALSDEGAIVETNEMVRPDEADLKEAFGFQGNKPGIKLRDFLTKHLR